GSVPGGPRRGRRPDGAAGGVGGDAVRRAGGRRGGGGGPWLGENVRVRNLRYGLGYAVHQRRRGEDQGAFRRHEPLEAGHGLREQRSIARQRQKLFWLLRGGERPKSRSGSAGEDRGPRAHGVSGCESPNIMAMRWVSFVGLKGLVTRTAPSRRASRRMRSSPSAVRTSTGSRAVARYFGRSSGRLGRGA